MGVVRNVCSQFNMTDRDNSPSDVRTMCGGTVSNGVEQGVESRRCHGWSMRLCMMPTNNVGQRYSINCMTYPSGSMRRPFGIGSSNHGGGGR